MTKADTLTSDVAKLTSYVAELATILARLEDWTYNHSHRIRTAPGDVEALRQQREQAS